MSAEVLLFVTAASANHKAINHFLLHFRDWDRGKLGDSIAHLVTSRNAYAIQGSESPAIPLSQSDYPVPDKDPKATEPPVSSEIDNGWSGASVKDVEDFLRDAREDPVSIFLLLDDQGVRDRTVILAERGFDEDTEELTMNYRKVRVPWEDAYIVWCNLDIANVNFEDYCDEEGGGDADGWWVYGEGSGDILNDGEKETRDEEIRRKLEETGYA